MHEQQSDGKPLPLNKYKNNLSEKEERKGGREGGKKGRREEGRKRGREEGKEGSFGKMTIPGENSTAFLQTFKKQSPVN
jgi:hypothetical protein